MCVYRYTQVYAYWPIIARGVVMQQSEYYVYTYIIEYNRYMVLLSVIVLFVSAAVLWYFSNILVNENKYRAFMIRYTKFFGVDMTKIPATPAVPDPMMPILKQGLIAGYMFRVLASVIGVIGLFLLQYI